MALQLSQSLRVKEQGSSDFAEEFLKNNTVLVINRSGNIHTSEIIFHFNCDIIGSKCELRKQHRLFSTDCASRLCKLVKHSRASLSGKE